MPMNIGQQVRQVRENGGMTLEELGHKIGKSKQWLSELERGNIRLTYEMAVHIARAFNETPDIFLDTKSKKISQSIDRSSASDETCATLEKEAV